MLSRMIFCLMVAFAAVAPFFASVTQASEEQHHEFPGFPARFLTMQRLDLSQAEARFSEEFPGKIAKFEQAGVQYVVRFVAKPTRMLHAATNCFRASGFNVSPLPRCEAPQEESQACFLASSPKANLLVSESIQDAHAQEFHDVSAWYWATQTGSTQGPWWSITTISRASDPSRH